LYLPKEICTLKNGELLRMLPKNVCLQARVILLVFIVGVISFKALIMTNTLHS